MDTGLNNITGREFPTWEQVVPSMGTSRSQRGNCVYTAGTSGANYQYVGSVLRSLRYAACLLLLMVVGVSSAWGQPLDDGLYYIKSKVNANPNYYLCPAIGCYYNNNVDQPHLTTYQSQDQNSVWEIKRAETEGTGNNAKYYYYLIHYKTGRYLKSNENFQTSDGKSNRKAVHLEVKPETLTDDFKFCINGSQIYPKVYDTTASGMSFNPKGNNQPHYVPLDGEAQGIIGLFNSTDGGSMWNFVQVPTTPCATPIIKYDGSNINISYPYSDETGITIYYTIDGSEPTTSSPSNSSTSFNISASGVIKVRAFANKTDLENSDEAVLWGSSRPFLIQSKEDINYYLVPSVNASNVNTSCIASENMQWTLQNAGSSTGGVPYYYLVNSNGKKVKYNTDYTLTMDEGTADANKFCVVEDGNSGYSFLIPINGTSTGTYKVCKSVFKADGNVSDKIASAADIKANSNDVINRSHWRFSVCNAGDDQKNLFAAPLFIVSDTETNYYLISSVGSTGFNIVPPTTSSGFATTSNTNADYENAPWMFKTASSDNWLTYYFIINAATGKYMYFDKNTSSTNNQAEAFSMKDISEKTDDNANRFQFVFVPTNNNAYYYIIPKDYANNFTSNKFYGLWRDGTNPLKTTLNRNNNNMKWTFSKFRFCNPPVFTESDGNISISCITTGSKIYFTENSSEPDITNNTQEYDATTWPVSSTHCIKAKAVAYDSDGSISSRVVTLLNKPDVILAGGPYTYKGTAWEPSVTSVSIGETVAPTSPATYTVAYSSNNTDAGTANVTITDADNTDYWYIWNVPDATFTIVKVPLTVTANDHTIYYGDMPANNGVTFTGFVHDETEAVLSGTLTYAYNYEQFGHISDNDHHYTITPSGLSSLNYDITYVNGTLTVGKKSIGQGALAAGFTISFDEDNNIILKDGDIQLSENTDFTVGNESTAGKYTSREITGEGNYIGNFALRNASVNFQSDINETEWAATFVAEKAGDSDIGHALPEGITAYIITSIVDDWAIPEQLNYIPAGIPVVLVSNKASNGFLVVDAQSGNVTAITSEQISNNMLEEVTANSAHFNTRTIYLLHNDEFVYNIEGDLGKGMVYLNPNHAGGGSGNPAPARLRIKKKDDTGIEDTHFLPLTSHLSDVWYTLDGRRLNGKPVQKGLYIINGKKVMVK